MIKTEKKAKKLSRSRGDISIFIVTLVLAGFGVLAVYSASSYVAQTQYGDKWYFVKKQAIGFVLGAVLMFVCGRFDYTKLKGKKVRYVALVVPIILLALVFVPGIGKSNYGATRWIGIGGFTLPFLMT